MLFSPFCKSKTKTKQREKNKHISDLFMWIKSECRKRPLVKGKVIQGRELLKRGMNLEKRWIRVQDGLTVLIMTSRTRSPNTAAVLLRLWSQPSLVSCYEPGHISYSFVTNLSLPDHVSCSVVTTVSPLDHGSSSVVGTV